MKKTAAKRIIEISACALALLVAIAWLSGSRPLIDINKPPDGLLTEVFMQSIWAENLSDEKNVTVAFRAFVPGGEFKLRLAAATTYQIFVGGEFVAYGPLRSAHGYSNVSDYGISVPGGGGYIAVVVASYRINTYYTVDEPPFFACEVLDAGGNKVLESGDFSAFRMTDRAQKVAKYSFQRPFAEIYNFDGKRAAFLKGGDGFPKLNTVRVKGNTLIETRLKNPEFERLGAGEPVESGIVYTADEALPYDFHGFYENTATGSKGFSRGQFESDILADAARLRFVKGEESGAGLSAATVGAGGTGLSAATEGAVGSGLSAATAGAGGTGTYSLYSLSANLTGFVTLEVDAASDCTVYVLFDEIIYDEVLSHPELGKFYQGGAAPVAFWRSNTLNVVKWMLSAGRHSLTAFEPYTMKHFQVAVLGDAQAAPGFITYENADASLEFSIGLPGVQQVFDAARRTFVQNAVDILTDCPSRERAGWLCDSYFSGRAELMFTGANLVERNMLQSYLLSPQSQFLPEGMLPMCYPADHNDGNYIANWALWLIVQLQDYARRTGDTEFTDMFRQRVYLLLDAVKRFENRDGLLERVDKWVFIEWSRANEFTMDVNYPSNMLYSGALRAAAALYNDAALEKKADAVKRAVLEQSYNGTFFEDNAVRKSGRLERTGNTTETCQYYAFYFGIADQNSHPQLFDTMFNVVEPGKAEQLFPGLYKSNAFIGNYLRLDYLARMGRFGQVMDECMDYFLFMAERTGTLWENDSIVASLNHGFASLAAEWVVKAYTGYSHADAAAKVVYFTQPHAAADVRMSLPVSGGYVKFNSRDGSTELTLPDGWRAVYL